MPLNLTPNVSITPSHNFREGDGNWTAGKLDAGKSVMDNKDEVGSDSSISWEIGAVANAFCRNYEALSVPNWIQM